MIEVVKDLATLTTIPETALGKLIPKINYIIANGVEETILKEENIVEFDIGIGTLHLLIEENSVKYKFVPSEELNKAVVGTIKDDMNPLKYVLEKALVNKITNIYKELL